MAKKLITHKQYESAKKIIMLYEEQSNFVPEPIRIVGNVFYRVHPECHKTIFGYHGNEFGNHRNGSEATDKTNLTNL
jgi:hypothetical protein